MARFTFADGYREAGLMPPAEIITLRQGPVNRITEKITNPQILDLACVYYGNLNVDLDWFREEFRTEDAGFSLINNERETRVLAALILGELIYNENAVAILAVSVGSFRGGRVPAQSTWLLTEAEQSFVTLSVEGRQTQAISTKLTPTITQKLTEEISGLVTNDWAGLLTILGKIRTEAQSSAKTTATQATTALQTLERQSKLMREESQMLWWLIGGHSTTLDQSFAALGSRQAAIAGALDLGELTTCSLFGPVAMPAMLERVIALAKKTKVQQSLDFASAIDGFAEKDLKRLQAPKELPATLAPVSEAIKLSQLMGNGVWHKRFKETTFLEPLIDIESIPLAEQLYRECLLEQLV